MTDESKPSLDATAASDFGGHADLITALKYMMEQAVLCSEGDILEAAIKEIKRLRIKCGEDVARD